jgi:hypothetical protein
MQQFIKIALLVFYVFFNAGLSYSMHFCGEDFQRINLYGESKTCCPNQDPMPGCCDDVSDLELPNTDQLFADAFDLPEINMKLALPLKEFLSFPPAILIEQSVFIYADSSPPLHNNIPIYISCQVFLI